MTGEANCSDCNSEYLKPVMVIAATKTATHTKGSERQAADDLAAVFAKALLEQNTSQTIATSTQLDDSTNSV